MDKIKNLQEKAKVFRGFLEKYATENADAESLLGWLTPLFMAIEKGKVVPPQRYEYLMALGKEPDFFECHRDVFSAQSDFVSALEDWESQEWYQL